MSVVLRLKRAGRRNRPFYRICAYDKRKRRDGRTIEELGYYDPLVAGETPRYELDEERVRYWLSVGARPSETVASLLRKKQIEVPGKTKRRKKAGGSAKA